MWMPTLGTSVVWLRIPLAVADRARDILKLLPGMSFLLKCQLRICVSFFFFFLKKAVEHYTMSVWREDNLKSEGMK